jgi:hypothetical protein
VLSGSCSSSYCGGCFALELERTVAMRLFDANALRLLGRDGIQKKVELLA